MTSRAEINEYERVLGRNLAAARRGAAVDLGACEAACKALAALAAAEARAGRPLAADLWGDVGVNAALLRVRVPALADAADALCVAVGRTSLTRAAR